MGDHKYYIFLCTPLTGCISQNKFLGSRAVFRWGSEGPPDLKKKTFFSIDSATQQLQVHIIIVAMDFFLASHSLNL